MSWTTLASWSESGRRYSIESYSYGAGEGFAHLQFKCDGRLHNVLGPAKYYANGHCEYWLDGEQLSLAQWRDGCAASRGGGEVVEDKLDVLSKAEDVLYDFLLTASDLEEVVDVKDATAAMGIAASAISEYRYQMEGKR